MNRNKVIFLLALSLLLLQCAMKEDKKIRYVALGDSYTIGEGAKPTEAWPVLLTKHLNQNGVNIELVANPSRTGWTTQDLIDRELSVCEENKPDFVTLLIGVNDWVQGVDIGTFHQNMNTIIDRVEALLLDKSRLVLVTIPDFGVTRTGAMYSGGRDITKGIKEFNDIIIQEAQKRNLKCVDIMPETQKMKGNDQLVAADGLHPSAKEYAIWETLIYPVVYAELKDK
jgi:lysophospholipase L1-like esterase